MSLLNKHYDRCEDVRLNCLRRISAAALFINVAARLSTQNTTKTNISASTNSSILKSSSTVV